MVGDLDLKSEGRFARAGENMTHRFVTGSFLSWGLRPVDSAIAFFLFLFVD